MGISVRLGKPCNDCFAGGASCHSQRSTFQGTRTGDNGMTFLHPTKSIRKLDRQSEIQLVGTQHEQLKHPSHHLYAFSIIEPHTFLALDTPNRSFAQKEKANTWFPSQKTHRNTGIPKAFSVAEWQKGQEVLQLLWKEIASELRGRISGKLHDLPLGCGCYQWMTNDIRLNIDQWLLLINKDVLLSPILQVVSSTYLFNHPSSYTMSLYRLVYSI